MYMASDFVNGITPAIEIRCINCDDVPVVYTWANKEDFLKDWNMEDDMPNIPMLDDALVFANINGVVYHTGTVETCLKETGLI